MSNIVGAIGSGGGLSGPASVTRQDSNKEDRTTAFAALMQARAAYREEDASARGVAVAAPVATPQDLQSSQSTAPELPLETYALPHWLADHLVEVGGTIGMSAADAVRPGAELAKVPEPDRGDYVAAIMDIYRGILSDNGIATVSEHYQAVIADPARSEGLRTQFLERMQASPEVSQLLGRPVSFDRQFL